MKKHQFSLELKKELAILSELDNFHAPLALLEDLGIIVLAIVIPYMCPSELQLAAIGFSIIIIGSRQRALATLLHEASHQTLAKNRHLNSLIGAIAGALILQCSSAYSASHLKHHRNLGLKDGDSDLETHRRFGLYDNRSMWDFMTTFLNPIWILKHSLQSLRALITNRLYSKPKDMPGALFVLLFWSLLLIVFGEYDLLVELLIFWVLPFFTSFLLINYTCELSEHYGRISFLEEESQDELTMTRNRYGNNFENFFFGIHSENFHLTHHLTPSIPYWNLQIADKVLSKDPNYRELTEKMGGLFTCNNRGNSAMKDIFLAAQENIAKEVETNE